MGIKDFFKVKNTNKESQWFGKTIAEMGRVVTLKSLKGEKICIDASGTIYSSILAMERINALSDSSGNTTGHLTIIFNKIIQLRQAGIEQLWIFDSPKPNEMKKLALEKRAERRAQATDEKVAYKLNTQHVQEVQQLLAKMGVMYIEAPPGIEAEQYGAFLTKGAEEDRFCKYMISSDSDVLVFGGNLLRIASKKSATGKTKTTVYQAFELDTLLTELGITYDQLVQLAVAMGTDFNEKTPRVGPATVLKQIKNGDIFLDPRQEKAMRYFKSEPPEDAQTQTYSQDYDKEGVVALLVDRGFKKERVLERLAVYEGEK
jgi:flap endonuclease-1